jgi:hypothetical protein
VKRNFDKFQRENAIEIIDPDNNLRIKLANELAEIAGQYGIEMLMCCGDYLLGPKIGKAHCIDRKIIEELFYKKGSKYSIVTSQREKSAGVQIVQILELMIAARMDVFIAMQM